MPGGEETRPTPVLVLPDAGNEATDAYGKQRIFYCLPTRPQLAMTEGGDPEISLTLFLERQPRIDELSIGHLIRQGQLAFTIGLSVPAESLDALADEDGNDYRPLFATEIRIDLYRDEAATDPVDGNAPSNMDQNKTESSDAPPTPLMLASATGVASNATIALSVTLDQQTAQSVLTALDGGPSGLTVETLIEYATASTSQTVHLRGSAIEIYDTLQNRVDRAGWTRRAWVEEEFMRMLDLGTITVESTTPGGSPISLGTSGNLLFEAFMRVATVVLTRETHDLPLTDPENRYSFRPRPHPMLHLDLTQSIAGARNRTLEQTVPLEEIFGGALADRDRSQFIHLVGPDDNSPTGVRSIPRRVRTTRSGPGDRDMRSAFKPQVAVHNGNLTSLAYVLTPDTSVAPSAHSLVASDLLYNAGLTNAWLAQDFVIDRIDDTPQLLHLPIVDDPAGALWRDRINTNRYWYPPVYELQLPAASDDPSSSSFLFTFQRAGVSAGSSLTTGLDGTVRFTLKKTMSYVTQAALTAAGSPTAQPVPTSGISVTLEIPVRDQTTGTTQTQSFITTIEEQGNTISVTADLLNDWVRLCYGALAWPGFQAQPPQLRVAYSFRAYVPLNRNDIEVAFGEKIALAEVVATRLELPEIIRRPVFSRADNTFFLPTGELRLTREAPRTTRDAPRSGSTVAAPIAASTMVASTLSRPGSLVAANVGMVTATAVNTTSPIVSVIRPDLQIAPELIGVIAERQYGLQTIVRGIQTDAVVTCDTFGGFYRDVTGDTDVAVGCQDALRLGEVSPDRYREIAELRSPRYRVYRSLQQPGRFLVLPATYRITRYGPAEPMERAYRPAIIIYASLNPDPAQNRYFFRATLQPDIPAYAREELLDALAAYTPFGYTPALDYPTEPTIQATSTYQWALPAAISTPEVFAMWDGFQISVSTNLTNALTLMTLLEMDGIAGSVTFAIGGGLTLTSELRMDSEVVGPWLVGPLAVEHTASGVTLTNHIERKVNISDIIVKRGTNPGLRQTVNGSLEPSATLNVPLASPADEVYPVYAVAGGRIALREMNIFVEDVVTNVFFVNLVNYANHNLQQLRIAARLKGTEHVYPIDIAEGETASVTMTFQLTTYIENKVLQYQVTRAFTDGSEPQTTDWRDWNLDTGISIALTWESIQ